MAVAQNISPPFGRTKQVPQTSLTPTPTLKAESKASAHVLLFSSAIAGGVEAMATYPFEYAKTRVQLQTVRGCRHNPFTVIANIIKHDGFGALYTGCSTLVLGTAFKVSVRFLSFNHLHHCLADDTGTLTFSRGVFAGFMAGMTEGVVAVTPMERLKTVLIDNKRSRAKAYPGELHFYDIIHTQNIRNLYRGLLPKVLKQSITQGVKMGSYNMIKKLSRRHDLPHNGTTTFVTGALASGITVYVTQPLDMIKTWAQRSRCTGTVYAFQSIVQQTGIRGLWSGSTLRVGRLAFSSSVLYTVYEKVAIAMTSSLEDEILVFTSNPRARQLQINAVIDV